MEKQELKQYFKVVDDTIIFTGNHLEVRIPVRYKVYDLLTIADTIKTLAIFEMIVNDTTSVGLLLPCIVHMAPSAIARATIDGSEYQVAEFYSGDKFILSNTLLKEPHLAYTMYLEFISLGNLPKFLDYSSTAFLFDTAENVCGINLRTPHTVFEMIYAHLFRDPDDLFVKYRYTDMLKSPVFIGTKSVAFGPDSTTAKIIGSYFNDGINSAFINASQQQSDLENLLRK